MDRRRLGGVDLVLAAALLAHAMLISPIGYREPKQIHRIVRDKARVQGAMASIVEWQSLQMQEYRYQLLTVSASLCAWSVSIDRCAMKCRPSPVITITRFTLISRSAVFLDQYIKDEPAEPHVGGAPNVTEAPTEMEQQFPRRPRRKTNCGAMTSEICSHLRSRPFIYDL